jgi:hypothetical protein
MHALARCSIVDAPAASPMAGMENFEEKVSSTWGLQLRADCHTNATMVNSQLREIHMIAQGFVHKKSYLNPIFFTSASRFWVKLDMQSDSCLNQRPEAGPRGQLEKTSGPAGAAGEVGVSSSSEDDPA